MKEVVFDVDMLNMGMQKRVFGEGLGCSVVTGNCCRRSLTIANSIKQSTQPNAFLGSFKCCNIFGLTEGCSNNLLLMGSPGNSPGAKGADVTTNIWWVSRQLAQL